MTDYAPREFLEIYSPAALDERDPRLRILNDLLGNFGVHPGILLYHPQGIEGKPTLTYSTSFPIPEEERRVLFTRESISLVNKAFQIKVDDNK